MRFSACAAFLERHRFLIAYLACVLVVFYCMLAHSNVDLDLWGVLSMGALIDQNFPAFPRVDIFSYTAQGQPWIYHEWGSGVVFYQVLKHLGTAGLFWFSWALVALQLLLVWRCAGMALATGTDEAMRNRRWNLFLFSASIFMVLGYLFFSITRCQLFSYLAYAAVLWCLQQARLQGRWKRLWLLPLVFLPWANLHGGFAAGLAAIGLFALSLAWERKPRQALTIGLILILCGAVTLINPYGPAFWEKLLPSLWLSRDAIWEWQNVLVAMPPFALVYTPFLLLWLWVAVWNWRKAERPQSPFVPLLLLAIGVEGWLHIKLAPFFLITVLCLGLEFDVPPVLYAGGRPAMLRFNALLARLGPALVATICAMLSLVHIATHAPAFTFPVKGSEPNKFLIHYPLGAIRFLQIHQASGNLWLPFDWGEFAYWVLYPRIRVSMDGRYETLYPPSVSYDNFAFYMPPYRLESLEKYPETDWVLIPAHLKDLLARLQKHPAWQHCYQDDMAVLYGKPGRCPAGQDRYGNQTQPLDNFLGDFRRFQGAIQASGN